MCDQIRDIRLSREEEEKNLQLIFSSGTHAGDALGHKQQKQTLKVMLWGVQAGRRPDAGDHARMNKNPFILASREKTQNHSIWRRKQRTKVEPRPGVQWFRPGMVVPSRDDRAHRQPHRRGQAQLNPDSTPSLNGCLLAPQTSQPMAIIHGGWRGVGQRDRVGPVSSWNHFCLGEGDNLGL